MPILRKRVVRAASGEWMVLDEVGRVLCIVYRDQAEDEEAALKFFERTTAAERVMLRE